MATLFRRYWQVQVDTISTTAMDVEFKFLRSVKPSPNRGTITLWNLNADHRHQLYLRNKPNGPDGKTVPIYVKVDAGYEQQHSVLFSGDLRELVTIRQGTDWKTTLSVDDGGNAIREARISMQFPKGASVSDVLREACKALGVGIGNAEDFTAAAEILGIKVSSLPGPLTLHGSAHDALKRVCNTIGVNFSIQQGALQLLPKGKPLNLPAVLLSSATGLVGSPEAAIDSTVSLGFAKEAKGTTQKAPTKVLRSNTSILKAKSLLRGDITPGRIVKVDSDAFKGDYICTSAEYSGQSWAQTWYTDMVLRSYT